jgi:hypothetical protein
MILKMIRDALLFSPPLQVYFSSKETALTLTVMHLDVAHEGSGSRQ